MVRNLLTHIYRVKLVYFLLIFYLSLGIVYTYVFCSDYIFFVYVDTTIVMPIK